MPTKLGILRNQDTLDAAELFGRQRELTKAIAAIEKSERTSAPAVLRIVGEAGIGKTLLAEHIVSAALGRGWLTLVTAAHSIQSTTPFVVVNRLVLAMLSRLGDDAARYVSGLEDGLAALDPVIAQRLGRTGAVVVDRDRYEEILARFFDGVGSDKKLLLACDDAQWMDADSLHVLQAVTARHTAGPFALLLAERAERSGDDDTIALRRFTIERSRKLATQRFPTLNGVALDTALQHADGNPFELLTLCKELADGRELTQDDDTAYVRDAIAGRVRALAPADREFLQLCTVIDEPIEYRLLFALHAEAKDVGRLLSGAARSYLQPEGTALRFRHALIGDAVRSTIASDVPLRRRVIAALQAMPEHTLDDLRRIGEHAAAAADAETARAAFATLIERAFALKAWTTVIHACEATLALGERPAESLVPFYSRYAVALRSNHEEETACDVLENVVERVLKQPDAAGVGILLSMLMATLWACGRAREALDLAARRGAQLQSDSDKAEIAATAMAIAAHSFDAESFQAFKSSFAEHAASGGAYATGAAPGAEAILCSYDGAYERASSLIDAAIAASDAGRRQDDTLRFTKLLIDFREHGCSVLEERLPDLTAKTRFSGRNNDFALCLGTWLQIAKGEWDRAHVLIDEALLSGASMFVQFQLASAVCMIGSLSNAPPSYSDRVGNLARKLQAWQSNDALLQFAPWYLDTASDESLIAALDRATHALPHHPPSISAIGFVPLGIVLLGEKLRRTAWLDVFVRCENAPDKSPWVAMQWLLARGVALQARSDRNAVAVLTEAADGARRLGAAFFSAYAAARAGNATQNDATLLGQLVVSNHKNNNRTASSDLTGREIQVARLVSLGNSNREIAEALFLSERTVERHLGNAFEKLRLNSRTQLAVWMTERDQAVTTGREGR